MKDLRAWVVSILLLLMGLLSLPMHAAEYLPPEKAFPFQAELVNANTAQPNVQVTFNIAPEYYMYRDEFAFTVVSPDGRVTQNGSVKMPPAQSKFDENFGKNVAYYHGSVRLNVPIRVSGEGEAAFKLVVASRGCADKGLCYPPRTNQVVLRISPATAVASATIQKKTEENSPALIKPVASADQGKSTDVSGNKLSAEAVEIKPTNSTAPLDEATAANTSSVIIEKPLAANNTSSTLDNTNFAGQLFEHNGLVWALLVVFGLGVLLSLTPCMFPMFPILTVLLAGQNQSQSQQSRWRGLGLAFAYVSGMALVYAAVGVIAAQTGVALQNYLQSPWVLLGFSLLLVLLALSMFDVFQIQMPERFQLWLQQKSQGKNGYWGALVMGAASALIASPCVTAPLVGLISYIAQTGQVVLGGLALLVLAYGMGLPLLLLGAGLGNWLPKAGAWMSRIKVLIGVLMIGVAVWVAQPLWGKYWQQLSGQHSVQSEQFTLVRDLNDIQMRVAAADRPVLIDLYADWCRSCIEMEHKTFPQPQVQQRMAQMQLLRVDMTRNTPQDTEILKHFGLYGPPGIIVLEPKTSREMGRVVGFESADQFAQSLDQMK